MKHSKKNLGLASNAINALILIFGFQTNTMDIIPIEPTKENAKIEKITIQAIDETFQIPKNIALKSTTIKTLLSDLTNPNEPLSELLQQTPIPIDFSADAIKSIFNILSKENTQIIKEEIKKLTLNQLIEGIRLLVFLDTPEHIAAQFVNCLYQLPNNILTSEQNSINTLQNLDYFRYKIAPYIKNQILGYLRTQSIEQYESPWQQLPIQNDDLSRTIYALAVSPDGKYLAVGQDNSRIVVINLENNTTKAVLTPQNEAIGRCRVISLQFSENGKQLIAGYFIRKSNNIILWDIENKKEALVFKGHNYAPQSIQFIPNNSLIVSKSQDEICLWSSINGEMIANIKDSSQYLSVSPDGTIIAHGSFVNMTLLDNNLKLINKINTSAGLLAFSPDGTKLAVIEYSDVIQKYNVVIRNITNYVNSTIEQPEPLLEFEIENPNPLKNMAFSPDGWMILTTSTYIQNINNFLWNTSTSNKVCAFSSGTPQPSFSSTAFTPDGNNIITIDPANNKSLIVLKIFDVHKQKEIFNYLNRCTLAELLIMQQLCQQGAENNISTFNQLQKALNNIMSSKETNN